MSAASIRFAQQRSESYNGPREVFLLDRDLAKLETYVYTALPTLATKDDLRKVEGALRAEIKEEVGKLDSKIEKVRTEVETVRTEVETVRTEVETVRTELQKEQKENRAWLLRSTVSVIGVMIAIATFFGLRETQVAYVQQPVPQQSIAPSVDTISALNELREIVMELKQATATKAEPELPTTQSSN